MLVACFMHLNHITFTLISFIYSACKKLDADNMYVKLDSCDANGANHSFNQCYKFDASGESNECIHLMVLMIRICGSLPIFFAYFGVIFTSSLYAKLKSYDKNLALGFM